MVSVAESHANDQFRLVSFPNGSGTSLTSVRVSILHGAEVRPLRIIDPTVRVMLSSGFNEVQAIRRFIGKGLAGFIQSGRPAFENE